MANNPIYLPEEILIQIFSRLPAKAVGRFRCLSKTWCAQLSSSQFVKLHLLNRTSNNKQHLLVICNEDHSLHTIDGAIVENTVSRKLEFGVTWKRVLGCCNGLVLLENTDRRELFLVNPTTLQLLKLSPLSLVDTKFSQYGLGYDNFTGDYKVVALTYCVERTSGRSVRFTHVYSVKSASWKRIATSTPDCHYPSITEMSRGAFVNGAVHGNSFFKVDVINAFDFADDVFREIPVPISCADNYDYFSLLVLEECLCITHTSYHRGDIEIWMMKHYGLANSWTKFTIPANREKSRCLPLCSLGDREIVFLTGNKLVVYNFRDGTTKNMVVDGDPTAYGYAVAYVDSLVSPNHQYSI